MAKMTIGSDPECFLVSAAGALLPVCGWLGGTKEKHVALPYGEVHEDGVAMEVTVPPHTDPFVALDHAAYAMGHAMNYAGTLRPGATMAHFSERLFSRDVLNTAGPLAYTFGCSPEYDAYSRGKPVPKVDPGVFEEPTGAWRFAGGHIHLGYRVLNDDVSEHNVALLCDATVGLALVLAGERQPMRRKFYGSPGRFRPTKYGMEYRTPSNQWLYSPSVRDAAAEALLRLGDILSASPEAVRAKWNSIDWVAVRAAIQNEDMDAASSLYATI